jgi:hypothetical protein
VYQFFSDLFSALLILGEFFAIVILMIVIFAFLTATIFIEYLPSIYNSVSKLGIYHRKIENKDKNSYICEFGETRKEKMLIVFLYNIVIAIPLFIVLIFIFYSSIATVSVPVIDLNNSSNLSRLTNPAQSPFSLNDISFILSIFLIPGFLLSFRILVNPTFSGLVTFNSELKSVYSSIYESIDNVFHKKPFLYEKPDSISDQNRITRIRAYKEQVISFYFSFIGATLILFLLFVLFQIIKTRGSFSFEIFYPTMNPLGAIAILITELIAIGISTILGELYLECFEPIDQN